MISNRLLQESLEDFKEIVRLPMALYDRKSSVDTSEIVFQGGGSGGEHENLRIHGVS